MTKKEIELQMLDKLHFGQSFAERITDRFGNLTERRIDPRCIRIKYSDIPPNILIAIYRKVISFFKGFIKKIVNLTKS